MEEIYYKVSNLIEQTILGGAFSCANWSLRLNWTLLKIVEDTEKSEFN